MAGIAGIAYSENRNKIDRKLIDNMLKVLSHRGYRSEIHAVERRCVLGANFNRESEKRMVISYDDCHKLLIIVDGDIFRVVDGSIDALSIPDAEIIRRLFLEHGEAFVEKIDGCYSIAIFDGRENKLLLVRDRVGYKPLFFAKFRDALVFSSEMKAILTHADCVKEIDLKSLNDFLSYGYFPNPGTVFRSIKQLRPGHMLVYNGNTISEHAYWKFRYQHDEDPKSESDYTEEFLGILETSVDRRIKKHGNAGAFLSGGLDTSGVVSIMRKIAGRQFSVFTAGFREDSYNEIHDASIVANHLDLEQYTVLVDFEKSFPELLKTLVWHHDAPFGDTSAIPCYLVSKLARMHTDVVFTGDLPDQLLGGSGHHVNLLHRESHDPIWRSVLRKQELNDILNKFSWRAGGRTFADKVKRFLYRESFPLEEQRVLLGMPVPPLLKRWLYCPELLEVNRKHDPLEVARRIYSDVRSESLLNRILYFDFLSWATDGLMVKVERTASAHGLKAISPYHDLDFLEFVSKLPANMKINVRVRKYIMRKALEPMLPKSTLDKSKQGFAMPIREWLIGQCADFVRDVLLDSRTLNRGYFKREPMKKMVERFLRGETDYASGNETTIISLITLELWHRLFMDGT